MYIFLSENQVFFDGERSNSKVVGGGLDVRVARRHEEVQRGSESVRDWTLKWWEGSK